MILVDTNILVALADRSDSYHADCQTWLETETGPLGFPATVLADACYLIDRFGGPDAEAGFLDAVGDGPSRRFRVIGLVDDDIRRMAALVRGYADRRFGGTDASIIAVAERLGITTVATINRRDFDTIRPIHIAALNIVPSYLAVRSMGSGANRQQLPLPTNCPPLPEISIAPRSAHEVHPISHFRPKTATFVRAGEVDQRGMGVARSTQPC